MALFKITTFRPAKQYFTYFVEADTKEIAQERFENEAFDSKYIKTSSDENALETINEIEEFIQPCQRLR